VILCEIENKLNEVGGYNMYKNDICILHLSDLHIKKFGDNRYSAGLRTLINSISQELEAMGMYENSGIIIAISGDIIDKGNYEEHKDTAVRFFKKLKEKIGYRVRDVVIVPGNHDKEIKGEIFNNIISKKHIEFGLDSSFETAQEEWALQMKAYENFFLLYNDIMEIFDKKTEKIVNTFGLEVVELADNVESEDNNICFLRMDTSWCSVDGDSTHRRMRIGKYQLNELHKEYQIKLTQKKPIMTIALMHHPLNHLQYEEEEFCYKYFLSKDLNVDVIMCGHVHANEAKNYFNYDKSLVTLTTGASGSGDDNAELRYSIYAINVFRNSCDIIMKKLIKNSDEFEYDFELYTRAGGKPPEGNKLCYPLRMNIKTSIKIDAPSPIERKRFFLLSEDLDKIPNIVEKITAISTEIDKRILEHKSLHESSKIENKKTNENPLGLFYIFLNEVCKSTFNELKSCFDENTKSRVHFRYFNRGKDDYPALCHFPKYDKEKSSLITVSKWDSFIKCVYESGGSLVLSANKVHSNIPSDWEDNITLIPCVRGNDVEVTEFNEIRPRLTFCISIKDIQISDSRILYLLAYFKIDTIMKTLINNYIDTFNIDVHKFLDYITEHNLSDKIELDN